MTWAIDLAEKGILPDWLTCWGIRRLCARTADAERRRPADVRRANQQAFVEELRRSPVAIHTADANAQHYEVPAAFYRLCLGRRLKYSGCYYPTPAATLDEAEEATLALYGERAQLADGQRILELGCGWGSLTLWMAEHYPKARIVGVSNSASQRAHILAEAAARGLGNVEIRTADMNSFDPGEKFDRVVSVEMFEHMRNYGELHRRIATWLVPGGKLFVHIFCHRTLAYPFETDGAENWMGRHFFTGGVMPSDDLLLRFQGHIALEDHWRVPGTHYGRTSRHWLANLDRHRAAAEALFAADLGPAAAKVQVNRWRMFFMACAELFAFRGGEEWWVAHYRFAKP